MLTFATIYAAFDDRKYVFNGDGEMKVKEPMGNDVTKRVQLH